MFLSLSLTLPLTRTAVDYIVIGAGSAGIQAGILFKEFNMSYVILERASTVGSFWKRFPAHKELISVNKWVRNHTQTERYDWHSLLGTRLKMRNVTKRYFPLRSHMERYLHRVNKLAGLNVILGVSVARVEVTQPCVIVHQDGGEMRYCARRRVLVGTGSIPKDEPLLRAMGGIPYETFRREMGMQKRVCILGNGNSGFETAQNVYDITDRVVIYGKHPPRLSAVTRYTGDVRTKVIQVMENLNAKLLDTSYYFELPCNLNLAGLPLNATLEQEADVKIHLMVASWLQGFQCERLVLATGFRSHIPGLSLPRNQLFPETSTWFQDVKNSRVHYIGWLMHGEDFQQGAGGFTAGFRYLIRQLVHHLRHVDEGVTHPSLVMSADEAAIHIMHRVQTAADLIIMQEGTILRDVLLPLSGNQWRYFEGVPYAHDSQFQGPGAVHLYFQWGDGRTASAVFDTIYRFSDTKRLANVFLHPVVECQGVVRHIHEDLEMAWNSPPFMDAVLKVARSALAGQLDAFQPRIPWLYVRATHNETNGKSDQYEAAEFVTEAAHVANEILLAVLDPQLERLVKVHDKMKEWIPCLFSERGANNVSEE